MVKTDNIFALLEKRGMTNKEFAEALGLSTGNVSDWKVGRTKPSLEVLIKISDYLETSIDFLLGRYFSDTDKETEFNFNFHSLNASGKQRLFEYTDDLAQLEKYTTAK
jgi:transcriptional regulator with XRE-family HTH domain